MLLRVYSYYKYIYIYILENHFNFTENRCIELHSPDGVHSCLLRATDPQEALVWFNTLHSAIARSTQRALLDANRALSNIIGDLKHIGWLSRRVGNEQVPSLLFLSPPFSFSLFLFFYFSLNF